MHSKTHTEGSKLMDYEGDEWKRVYSVSQKLQEKETHILLPNVHVFCGKCPLSPWFLHILFGPQVYKGLLLTALSHHSICNMESLVANLLHAEVQFSVEVQCYERKLY